MSSLNQEDYVICCFMQSGNAWELYSVMANFDADCQLQTTSQYVVCSNCTAHAPAQELPREIWDRTWMIVSLDGQTRTIINGAQALTVFERHI